MRAVLFVLALGVCIASCATSNEDVGSPPAKDAGPDGKGGSKGGSGGALGGSGGTGAFGGTPFTGGSGGLGASGGFGATGGFGGLEGGADAADAGNGFGPCVTQQEIDSQGSGSYVVGFCSNPFGVFSCFGCPQDATKPGDLVCSPTCICAPLPALCTDDAGSDAPTDAEDAADASADASSD